MDGDILLNILGVGETSFEFDLAGDAFIFTRFIRVLKLGVHQENVVILRCKAVIDAPLKHNHGVHIIVISRSDHSVSPRQAILFIRLSDGLIDDGLRSIFFLKVERILLELKLGFLSASGCFFATVRCLCLDHCEEKSYGENHCKRRIIHLDCKNFTFVFLI